MLKKYFVMLIFLFIIQSLNAQSDKDNNILIIPTIDYSINDRWYKTISENPPKIIPIDKVVKGQKFYLLVFLLKYGKDSKNKANVIYNLKMLTPSGNEYFNELNIPALSSVINNNFIMMSENNLFVKFESEDEFGEYQIIASVKDLVNKSEIKINTSIELVEEKKTEIINNEKLLKKWLIGNFDNPEPEKLISGIYYYINSAISKDNSSYPLFLGFTVSSLGDNQYLFPELFNEYKKSDLRTKFFVLNILQYFEENDLVYSFLNNLSKNELNLYKENKNPRKLFTTVDIFDPAQLDALWGAFYASGKYEYVLAIINSLNLKEENPTVYKAALWSIENNYQNIYLVRNYCDYIYKNEKISNLVKQELAKIVNSK